MYVWNEHHFMSDAEAPRRVSAKLGNHAASNNPISKGEIPKIGFAIVYWSCIL